MPSRDLLRTIVLVGAWCGGTLVAAQPSADADGGVALLREMERSISGLIARCERSVVAIAHTDQTPDQLAGKPTPNRRATAQQRLLFQNPGIALPGALGRLQASPAAAVEPSGAGVVIEETGLILTQYRVVQLGHTHLVTDVSGERYLAKILAADSRSGLAVLAVERPLIAKEKAELLDFAALPIGNAEELTKGRFVIAIGNPFSIESDGQPTASWGSITNTALKAPRDENLNDVKSLDGAYRTTLHHFGSLLQTDARLGWNASGGALISLDGELVGVLTTAAAIAGHEQPAGYAIPLNAAMRRVIGTMRQGMEPEYGLLGVNFNQSTAVNPRTGRSGVTVNGVFTGGPAQGAGIRAGDLLLTIDDRPIRSAESLQLLVGSLPPGQAVRVAYERGDRLDEAQVRLAKAFVPEGQIVTRRPSAWRGIRVDYPTAIPPDLLQRRAQEGHLDADGCVVISEVERGSISWNSGVRPYSYVSHVSGRRVRTPDEFYAAVREAKDNVKLKFTKPLPNTRADDAAPK